MVHDVCNPLDEKIRDTLRISINNLVQNSNVIWQSDADHRRKVIQVQNDIVVKVIPQIRDYTEVSSLQFLAQHCPDIPAPRFLGFVLGGTTGYIFMTRIHGTTLERVWKDLSYEQKCCLQGQLQSVISQMRAVQNPSKNVLGGVGGEGCKDARQSERHCKARLTTCAQYRRFQFSCPRFGGSAYLALLQTLWSPRQCPAVFSHGDLRPENILVTIDENGCYMLTGLIDWENSGFYPDYFESTKATNNLSTTEESDWYSFLPHDAAPATYPIEWLLDRIWDVHVA
jgi:aminoglycoside phosphotransferase (APT) family kinase protein